MSFELHLGVCIFVCMCYFRLGDIYMTRAAFGVDDCAGTHADEEVCDDEDDPDTFSDLELPSPACANA